MTTDLITIGKQPEGSGGGRACCSDTGRTAETVQSGAGNQADGAGSVARPESITQYTVVGMTCGHCVASVTEEVGAVEGVTAVDVDLASGRLTVTSVAPLPPAAIEAAVDEAGYRLAL